jgi:predicted acetyltransferase
LPFQKAIMQIIRLSEKPQYYTQAIELIEVSLGYTSEYHYNVDFYPLMNSSNHHNCYLLINGEEVVGHIGIKTRSLQYKKNCTRVILIGGVAIKSNYQGKGHFKIFFQTVLSFYKDYSLAFLWSDLSDLYLKFDFHQAGRIYSTGNNPPDEALIQRNGYQKISLEDLTVSEKLEIQTLYNSIQTQIPCLTRSQDEWNEIENIKSMNAFIKKSNGKIVAYFFSSKGMDLQNIIHEFVFEKDENTEFLNDTKIWNHTPLADNSQHYYGFLIKVLDHNKFNEDFSLRMKIHTAEEIQDFFTNIFPIHIFGCDSI